MAPLGIDKGLCSLRIYIDILILGKPYHISIITQKQAFIHLSSRIITSDECLKSKLIILCS